MRKVLKVVAALAAVGSLAGCSSLGIASSATHSVNTRSVAIADARSEKVVSIPNGIIATGSVRSTDRSTTGQVTITKTSDAFILSLTHFTTTDHRELLLAIADTDVTLNQCAEGNLYQIAFGDAIGTKDASFSEPIGLSPSVDDPTFLKTFMIVQYPTGDGQKFHGCTQPIIGLTALTWTAPDTRPRLVVKDGGSQAGAIGTVTLKDGVPWSYRTHQGDTWAAIAARFGITQNDLTYLNPIRHGNVGEAYTDQVLNLSKANRGDSESRRG